jgi:hypothetical protein
MGISIFHIPLTFAQVNIPVIVVLTKYDLLVTDHFRACSHMPDRKVEAAKRAKSAFIEVTKKLKAPKVPFVPVTTLKKTQEEYGGQLISSVTSSVSFKIHCRSDAHGVGRGDTELSAGCRGPMVNPLDDRDC